MNEEKLEKFSHHINALILLLIDHRNSLAIHSRVDQFYYMQKLEELKVLFENGQGATLRLQEVYAETFCRWQRDVRFLNRIMKQWQEAKA